MGLRRTKRSMDTEVQKEEERVQELGEHYKQVVERACGAAQLDRVVNAIAQQADILGRKTDYLLGRRIIALQEAKTYETELDGVEEAEKQLGDMQR